MSDSGHFKKTLSLVDLTMIGMGTVFGSGWLFAASHVASLAGQRGIFSWVIAAIAVLTLGVVYCELGAALPRTGGAISYLHISHGPLMSLPHRHDHGDLSVQHGRDRGRGCPSVCCCLDTGA